MGLAESLYCSWLPALLEAGKKRLAGDMAKVAGHAISRTTSQVYDRALLEATDRFGEARIKGRERSGNESGNAR